MTQKELRRWNRYKKSFLKTIAKHYMTEKRIKEKESTKLTSPEDCKKIMAILSEYWDCWVVRVTPLRNYPILKFVYNDFNGYLQVKEIVKDPYKDKYLRIERLYSAMEGAARAAFLCRTNVLYKVLDGWDGRKKNA